MRVLYIGGTGEISCACAARSVEVGHDVAVFNRGRRGADESPLPASVERITGDLADEAAYRALGRRGFDVVRQSRAGSRKLCADYQTGKSPVPLRLSIEIDPKGPSDGLGVPGYVQRSVRRFGARFDAAWASKRGTAGTSLSHRRRFPGVGVDRVGDFTHPDTQGHPWMARPRQERPTTSTRPGGNGFRPVPRDELRRKSLRRNTQRRAKV